MIFVICNKNGSQQTSDKSEQKQCINRWKQGIGFILSVVATLNIINIIKHMICKVDVARRSFFRGSKQDENCVGLQKAHLKVRIPHLGTHHDVTISIQR